MAIATINYNINQGYNIAQNTAISYAITNTNACTVNENYALGITNNCTFINNCTFTNNYAFGLTNCFSTTGIIGTGIIGTGSTGCFDINLLYNYNVRPQEKEKSFKEKLSEIIKSRCSPKILSNRKSLTTTADIREQRARETLRRVIGDKYTNFIKHGFISVKARSGLVYQIFSGHGITSVFNQGKLVERLCVVLNGDFPPTDSIIMRYLLILNNEQQFRNLAVKHSIDGYQTEKLIKDKEVSLVEIFRELKKQVA